ncbi:caspase domain-containing protein [Aspergillus terricola var. indicus]
MFVTEPKVSTQRCAKRALLIASPFGRLQGPENDVKSVALLLEQNGFMIQRCCGSHATRRGILDNWRRFISDVQENDIILIYYSGHGGLVQPPANGTEGRRYQFIVPMDYKSDNTKFNGILDIEISALLHRITRKTSNVTAVLDCCHSGRIARSSLYGDKAVPKNVPGPSQQAVLKYLEKLQGSELLDPSVITSLEGNPEVVRIVACADQETAWEYDDGRLGHRGVVTEALVDVLTKYLSLETGVSWRSIMMRVSELVATRFPDQHPHVEGPENRVPFSLETRKTTEIPVVCEGTDLVLKAGRIAGVREKNQYRIMPSKVLGGLRSQEIGIASVTRTTDFEAFLKMDLHTNLDKVTATGTRAIPVKEFHHLFPISVSEDLRDHPGLRNRRLVRPIGTDNDEMPFAYIETEHQTVCLLNASRQVCASFGFGPFNKANAVERAIRQAEDLSKSGHLLNLKADFAQLLNHKLRLTFHNQTHRRNLALDGTADLMTGDRIILELENEGDRTIYVSVFNINVAGTTFLVSTASPRGIELLPEGPHKRYVLGQKQYSLEKEGLQITWPKNLPATAQLSVPEYLVCIVSSAAVDLRCLESHSRHGELRGDPSQLEKLAYELSYGQGRDCAGEGSPEIQWDLVAIPFKLHYSH